MDVILITIICFLVICVVALSLAILYIIKKTSFLSSKEKKFLIFVVDIFEKYGEKLGIQSVDQHKQLCDELNKIKTKYLDEI